MNAGPDSFLNIAKSPLGSKIYLGAGQSTFFDSFTDAFLVFVVYE